MYDLKQIIQGNEDLWIGNGLSPTNWPDIEKAFEICSKALNDALVAQNMEYLKKVTRWIASVQLVISATLYNIEDDK